MKRIFLSAAALVSLTLAVNAQKKPVAKPATKSTKAAAPANPLRNQSDSLSYAFGLSLGSYLKSQEVNQLNYALLIKAIDQVLKGQTTFFDPAMANQVMSQVGAEKQRKRAEVEKVASKKFLEENKKRPGVTTTASGLQYEVITKGTGPLPAAGDTVTAHYRGMLVNGKEFDNSYKRGQPLTIPVTGVIPGWTEALQLMPVGSKWKLFIPSELGYGDYGAGQDIPGGAALVFEVELISITNKQ